MRRPTGKPVIKVDNQGAPGRVVLTKDNEFVVGEAKAINYFMATFMLALFLLGTLDAVARRFRDIDYQSYIFSLALIPAIYCLYRATSKRVYIRINKTGIFQDEILITVWSNLLKVSLAQIEQKSRLNLLDNFILVLEYMKPGSNMGFRRKIPLGNTQNKSEEDILAAVNYFWEESKKEAAH